LSNTLFDKNAFFQREGFDFNMLNDGLQDLIDALDIDYLFILNLLSPDVFIS